LSPRKLDLFVWHKSLGILLLVLVVLRLAWRLVNPTPTLPAGLPIWEQVGARLSHGLLYLLLFAMPISGWVISSASKVPFKVFWLWSLPALTAPDKALSASAKLVHLGLFWVLGAVLLMHIAAALRHHFLLRNAVLVRMLPWGGH
jgi:cytochrome b561